MFARINVLVAATTLAFTVSAQAQSPRGTAEASIGGARVSVEYGRPSLGGRDMLSKAPVGTVWRTGADTATTFTTAADLVVGGATVPAGSHSLFTKRVDDKTWHVVFNQQTGQWGTQHDASQDLAEAPLTWEQSSSSVEQFTIELSETSAGGEMKMLWGTHVLKVPLQTK